MTTSPEQWRRAEAIFVDAQERQGAARRAFLDQACGDDAALRQEVESLLDADEATGAFLDEPLRASPSVLDEPLPIGAQVGRYRLLELLGEGGMGQVFLAERADGAYEQQVALKLIKPDMAIETLRQRFRQERQALAQLQHPGIARILDGGETDDGWPYLVMEYVDGLPIDRDCAQRQRSLDERLSMFRRICDAVHAAHRNLIVHRDLKPSNILVTAAGAPVLLDFGIAKLLAQDHNRPDITRTGGRPMTPRWASPEQVMGDPTTTAMDVYSLGAILYFLLAGAPPYHDAPEAAITQAVLRGAPPPPSAVAADPARRRRVSGDLDAIVARALHRDPQQRYATVEHLADDLLRHLGSLPVQARPATLAYRTRCYLRRNRVLVGAGVLTAASLAGGLALSWMQYRRAFAAEAQARARFAQVREMGRDLVFDVHRQIAPLPGSAPAQRVVLERGTQYLASLRPDPTADPQLALDVADGYRRLARLWSSSFNVSLGSPVEAARALDRSAELYDALLARDPTNATAWAGRIRCETQRADVHLAQRHAADGHATALRALAMGPPAIHSQADVRSARYQAAMQAAIAAREIGKPNEGLELLVRARELGAALPEAGPADPAFLGTRGTILAKIGHFDAAIDSTRGALALLQRQHAGTPGDLRTEIRIAALQTSLGQILLSARRGNEAR
ncbi:MAG: serine/threonine-protein kinase [Planctomycetota bacterium]